MVRVRSWIPAVLFALTFLAFYGCGGDGGGGNTGPVDPEPVATVEVSPPTGALEVGQTAQLTVTLKDAAGATLTNRMVTYSSSAGSVATVSTSGLVTAMAKGDATITATSEGRNGTAAFSISLAIFNPQQNATLGGTVTYSEVNIPDGVTVTLSGDLDLNSEGAVTIAGDLAGDCAALSVTGAGNMTMTGDIDNDCSDLEAEGADIIIVGNGELTIGGVWTSSGNVDIKNDPTLTDADFILPALSAGPPGPELAAANFPCIAGGQYIPKPAKARDGVGNQPLGTRGRDGKRWVLSCNGDIQVPGGMDLQGQHGGDGGHGKEQDSDHAEATGGQGGDGGKIVMRALGDVFIGGSGNMISGGDAGAGGDAWALGLANPDPVRAPGAKATGGRGGDPGTPTVKAAGGIAIDAGALTMKVGAAGDGGDAIAIGADGKDAADRDGGAQRGGEADATGGHGGITLSKNLEASSGVIGADQVTVVTPHSGHGGKAYADGGKGGDGDDVDLDGEKGGDMDAVGGGGGKNDVRDFANQRVQDGGDGGAAVFGTYPAMPPPNLTLSLPNPRKGHGTGGDGVPDCVVPWRPGGLGGPGGSADGKDGEGGDGKAKGAPGGVQFETISNAGDGKDGAPHGDGGEGGNDGVAAMGGKFPIGENFQDGADGTDCPVPPTYGSLMNIAGKISSDGFTLARHMMPPVWTGPFQHMFTTIPDKPRAMDHTSIQEWGATVVNIDADHASLLDSFFDCDDTGSYEFVRCPGEQAIAPGEYVAVSMILNGMLQGFPDKYYQYALVFDQDGDPSNNFVATHEPLRDGLGGADRIYDVIHNPGDGWFARAGAYYKAQNQVFNHPSGARVIANGNTIVFLIPKSEFEADMPKFKLTIFCHEGDYGLEGGPFNGDHQPEFGSPFLEIWPDNGRGSGSD